MQREQASTYSMNTGVKKNWYALRSKPRKEEALYSYLNANQHEVFFPRIQVNPKNPRAAREKPYFPGYMFVETDLTELGENAFQWLPFSHGLVLYGDQPAVVPQVVINELKTRMQELAFLNLQKQKTSRFIKGQRVRITQGPLAGYKALFDSRLSGGERVRVLLTLLGNQQRAAELEAAHITEYELLAGL